ncbi:hypothetical protein [Cellulomonas sp.]|uniref:hypothetical protein n=1 Tax=Cellulomonas sp. TaxID=40001 RepID=UPI002810EB14|nr:hypothetical protein [Cellulomonas sp.]
MSVTILGSAHANLLATAASRTGIIVPHDAAALSRTLLEENIDAYLARYWDGPSTYDDWDELDEDEKDGELVDILAIRANHQYAPAPEAHRTPDNIRPAVERWQYQATANPAHRERPGWQAMIRLLDALTTSR